MSEKKTLSCSQEVSLAFAGQGHREGLAPMIARLGFACSLQLSLLEQRPGSSCQLRLAPPLQPAFNSKRSWCLPCSPKPWCLWQPRWLCLHTAGSPAQHKHISVPHPTRGERVEEEELGLAGRQRAACTDQNWALQPRHHLGLSLGWSLAADAVCGCGMREPNVTEPLSLSVRACKKLIQISKSGGLVWWCKTLHQMPCC